MPRCRLLKRCPFHHVYLPRIFAHLVLSSLSGESHLPSDVCTLFSRLVIHTYSLLLLLYFPILSPASIPHIFPSVLICLLHSTLSASSFLQNNLWLNHLFFSKEKSAPILNPDASSISTLSKSHPLGFIPQMCLSFGLSFFLIWSPSTIVALSLVLPYFNPD